MTELKTRFAIDADAEAISAMVNAAFKVERFFIDRDRIDPGKVREMLLTGKYLLAEESGALIACVYVELRGSVHISDCSAWTLRGKARAWGEKWWRKWSPTRERLAANSSICES